MIDITTKELPGWIDRHQAIDIKQGPELLNKTIAAIAEKVEIDKFLGSLNVIQSKWRQTVTDNEILDAIKSRLHDMAFLDIQRASDGGSKMGAFILGSCFIDYLTGFWVGRESKGKDYKRFVKAYLHSYDDQKLYTDLRNKLVHNYSEGGSYIFVDNKHDLHFKRAEDNRIIINLENFILEIQGAMHDFFSHLDSNGDQQKRAIARFKSIGLLGVGNINLAD